MKYELEVRSTIGEGSEYQQASEQPFGPFSRGDIIHPLWRRREGQDLGSFLGSPDSAALEVVQIERTLFPNLDKTTVHAAPISRPMIEEQRASWQRP